MGRLARFLEVDYELIIVNIILNRVVAFMECGALAGIRVISPSLRWIGCPETVASASPSKMSTRAS
jgi:hypothetical protein